MPRSRRSKGMRRTNRRRQPVGRRDLRKLQQVHSLLATGEVSRAAVILEDLAQVVRRRRRLGAGWISIAAGRAHLRAGDIDLALEAFRRGLGLMASRGQIRRLKAIGGSTLDHLQTLGLEAEAEELRSELLAGHPGLDFARGRPRRRASLAELPPVCPHCGAPIRPDELEVRPQGMLLCAYCGLAIQAEQA